MINNLGIIFDEIVSKYPNNIALLYPDEAKITYSELSIIVDKFSRYLINLNCNNSQVIVIFHDKKTTAYAIMLACLKCGITYTNLDTFSPLDRLEKQIQLLNPRIIFYPDSRSNDLKVIIKNNNSISFDSLSKIKYKSSKKATLILDKHIGHLPAYLMFTSGSTGEPKAVVISHYNILNLLYWAKDYFQLTSNNIFTGLNPMHFDNSVFDFYLSIFSGATLLPVKHELLKSPDQLLAFIEKSNADTWFSVPSLLIYLLNLRLLRRQAVPNIKKFIFGGEGFPKKQLYDLYLMFKEQAELINVYGPTEITCICSAHKISSRDFKNMDELTTLGKLAPGFEFSLLSDKNKANSGQLVLSGPQVGLGYYKNEGLNKKYFIQNPSNKYYNQSAYLTGDIVSYDKELNFYFIGRTDHQIKHMGYRIELNEIDVSISSISEVEEVCTIYVRSYEIAGMLISFLVTSKNFEYSNFIKSLKEKLPKYMIPNKFIYIPKMPKTNNGKTDRNALEKLVKL